MDTKNETIEDLRNQLKNVLKNPESNKIKKDSISLASAAYNGLLSLAQFKPINEEDPVTQEKISFKDQVVVSEGHQFDIKALLKFHDLRDCRDSELYEKKDSKWLLNPITNKEFDPLDVLHIQEECKAKSIDIQNLRTIETAYQEGKEIVEKERNLFAKGEALLKQATKAGHADAAFLLSLIYFDDFANKCDLRMGKTAWWGQKQDFALGLEYLKIATARDHHPALLFYAGCLFMGRNELNIEPDKEQALKILDELIEKNCLEAIIGKLDNFRLNNLTEISDADKQFSEFKNTLDKNSEPQAILTKVIDYSKLGSEEAIKVLIQVYREGDEFLMVEPNEELAKSYTLLRDKLQNEKNKQILSLLEKASNLGHANSSYDLAILYFESKSPDYEELLVPRNIAKAIEYYQLSLDQGKPEAALKLAEFYLGRSYFFSSNEVDQSAVDGKLENAVMALEKGCKTGADGADEHDRGICALRLAQLFRDNKIQTESVEQRRTKMQSYYEMSSKLGNPQAKVKLGVLYLVGDSNLLLTPDVKKAEEVFGKNICSTLAYNIAREIGKIANHSSQNISYYLFWIFRSFELGYLSSIKALAFLLNNGVAFCYHGVDGSLKVTPNENLAKRWESLSASMPDSEYDFDGSTHNEIVKTLASSEKYQSLVKDTYNYFNLESQPSFIMKEKSTVILTVKKADSNEMKLKVDSDMLTNNRYMRVLLGNKTFTISDNTENQHNSDRLRAENSYGRRF